MRGSGKFFSQDFRHGVTGPVVLIETPPVMHRLLFWIVLACSVNLSSGAADYVGKVGKLEAVFSLEWHEDGSVSGAYGYPAKPTTIYGLAGSNPAEGELYLEEYTGETLTARCYLKKIVTDGAIVWSGEMHNSDGRVLPMAFARARAGAAPTLTVDDNTANRRALLAAIPEETRWDDFPLADEVVEFVPVDLEGGQSFEAEILRWQSDGIGTTIRLLVADADMDGNWLREKGRELKVRVARTLPLESGQLVERKITATFAADGSLHSLNLVAVAVTHVRASPSGKLEVRGMIDLLPADTGSDWDPDRFAEQMRTAPVIEFLPDKLALDLDPSHPSIATGEVSFQSIRLVRDHGIAVQSTDAGPGSLELESLTLDPEPGRAPWIAIEGLGEALRSPPTQFTGEAG
jgi:hypothetical protein